jgi:hypothetical protein
LASGNEVRAGRKRKYAGGSEERFGRGTRQKLNPQHAMDVPVDRPKYAAAEKTGEPVDDGKVVK